MTATTAKQRGRPPKVNPELQQAPASDIPDTSSTQDTPQPEQQEAILPYDEAAGFLEAFKRDWPEWRELEKTGGAPWFWQVANKIFNRHYKDGNANTLCWKKWRIGSILVRLIRASISELERDKTGIAFFQASITIPDRYKRKPDFNRDFPFKRGKLMQAEKHPISGRMMERFGEFT